MTDLGEQPNTAHLTKQYITLLTDRRKRDRDVKAGRDPGN